MRFRLCCTCDDEEKVKNVENKENCAQSSEPPAAVLPTVITQEPKNVVEPIQLDRITEVSVEESSVQITDEQSTQNQAIPVPKTTVDIKQDTTSLAREEDCQISTKNKTEVDELYNEFLNLLVAERNKLKYTPPDPQPHPPVNTTSNISVETSIGEDKLNFSQIAPDLYRGTFKGSQFHIIQGRIHDDRFALNETDKAAIQLVYNNVMESMQRGLKELTDGVNAFNCQGQSAATINTKYITRSGQNAVMTFKAIGQGHFRSTYEGKEFTIFNGQLLATDGNFDEKDRELILQTYNNSLIGMEQGLMGMQQGMLGMKMGMQTMQMNAVGGSAFAETSIRGGTVSSVAGGGSATAYASTGIGGSAYASAGIGGSAYASAVGGVATAHLASDGTFFSHASYNVLANGRDTLKRMRSLNHGKRISLLEGGLMAEPRQPLIIEDITEKSKKPRYFDDVDGCKLAEPIIQKTTFTPQAIIYDDPKTYEEQDKNELPVAKQLDEYIISVDANFNSENRYHFHKAKPRRVLRAKLNPREKFRLASPERYSLFEGECLKLHNQYRKIHGIPPLVHNEFLSQVAKEWAEHLALKDAFYHRPKNEYGENLYYVEGMPCRAKMAVKAWYDEIDLYDFDNPKFSREVGHFTQLVWKDTREVGTGVAQIGDKVWVCCNYHPAGNYLDKMNDEFVPRPLMKSVKRN